ncbi:DsbA family protein [Shewanella gelidimarina]|uniref:DsbA family protein n=1 Tax=Shewanella gelidimarina TaxID=56813 RepID=UPI00200EEBCB|nr:DsbA family protein [Shewanella gelidimarina]MCL1057319.1 DsbA family protein [Shewanella gelidimarina]
MSVKTSLMPYLALCLSSNALLNCKRYLFEFKRKLLRQPHSLKVFIKIDDPYSYILLQALAHFIPRYVPSMSLNIVFYPLISVPENAFPEPILWQKNAVSDCQYLAKLYCFDSVNSDIEHHQSDKVAATKALLACGSTAADIHHLVKIFADFWQGKNCHQPKTTLQFSPQEKTSLSRNSDLIQKLGHYQTATIHYAGEWYWGVDRLAYLEQRLISLYKLPLQPTFTKTRLKLGATSTLKQADISSHGQHNKSLTLYFSIRSPYSHLGLEQAVLLARKYHIPLIVKPVLPMVMRGLAVPHAKKMYIFHDTKREARRLNINYGKVADPLGLGVERCYALFEYAEAQGKGTEYLLNYSRAVNSEGLHSDTDRGLKVIVERSGLDWAHAQSLLKQTSWRQWAQHNLDEMMQLGLWGVPSFCYQDSKQQLNVWGQDRLQKIVQTIHLT